nr:hypothetical protein [Aeromicrobium ginsengisoli]
MTAVCEQHDLTIRITDGNHDDHSRLAMIEPVDGVRWVTDRIGFFERGHRWLWADTTLVSLGGAPSVDFEHRTSGKTWWPEEVITDDEVRSATADGHADVMLTHDAPEPALPAVQRILDGPSYWSEAALVYAAEGRAQVTKAFSGVTPRLLIHGHMHVADRGAVRIPGAPWDTQVVSLNCDEGVGNLGTLDLESLNVEVI